LNQAPAQILNLTANGYNATLARANSNGLLVAGEYLCGPSCPGKPLLYDFSNGTFSTPTGSTYTYLAFSGISGDGSTAVGAGSNRTGGDFPILWTSAGFTTLPGGTGRAKAISANGQYAAGNVYTPGTSTQHAALWSGGLQTFTDLGELASLPGWKLDGKDVSQDGKVVVIRGEPSTGGDSMALIWTSSGGLQKLTDALGAAGIDVSAWDLKDATAVSPNGKIIAGYGLKGGVAVGFVARMP